MREKEKRQGTEAPLGSVQSPGVQHRSLDPSTSRETEQEGRKSAPQLPLPSPFPQFHCALLRKSPVFLPEEKFGQPATQVSMLPRCLCAGWGVGGGGSRREGTGEL